MQFLFNFSKYHLTNFEDLNVFPTDTFVKLISNSKCHAFALHAFKMSYTSAVAADYGNLGLWREDGKEYSNRCSHIFIDYCT